MCLRDRGTHQAHVDYSNISIPNPDDNIAKFTFDLKVEITDQQTGSSSSYVPPETETDPVDNDDEGEEAVSYTHLDVYKRQAIRI